MVVAMVVAVGVGGMGGGGSLLRFRIGRQRVHLLSGTSHDEYV